MEQSPGSLRRLMAAATNRSLLDWEPVAAVVVVTVLLHLLTTVDLAAQDLTSRTLLAAIAIAPLFILVAAAHGIADRIEPLRTPLVLMAYLLGGAIRGAMLEAGLLRLHIGTGSIAHFRVPAGVVLVTLTCIAIGAAWTTVEGVRGTISELRDETIALEQALQELRTMSLAQDVHQVFDLGHTLRQELSRIARSERASQRGDLNRLVNDVVRPLSHEFARQVPEWTPPAAVSLRATLGTTWESLNPLDHLPPPVVAAGAAGMASAVSLVAVQGWRGAVVTLAAVLTSLMVCVHLGERVARRLLRNTTPPWRDLLITVSFSVMGIVPAAVSVLMLRDTANPLGYVLPTLIGMPIFGWVIMTGSAAWQHAQVVTVELQSARDHLRWLVARINLLSWHHKGVVSRLLHGPIQNNIRVGAMRLASADDEAEARPILDAVLDRIDAAVAEALDQTAAARRELAALDEVSGTWAGIADVVVHVAPECRATLATDPATASIVVDLVHEACSNAIRHAGATELVISCTATAELVHLDIVDNGEPYVGPASSGLGTVLLDACSVSFERERRGERNHFSIDVPAPAPAVAAG